MPTIENDFVGKTIGKYRIEEVIGRGAMAEVYRAFHPLLNRYVAIKILHNFLSEKTDILNRFQLEARNIAALAHPNIIQIHDFDSFGNMYYMVMEYIDGTSLKEILKDAKAQGDILPLPEALRIAKDVGVALDYAHRQGVVHRDVKPANVLMDRSQRVVLADFGLARILANPQMTATGAIIGTPAFMSPEQGTGQPGDARSDIYSLGAMLYQLLTGEMPFTGESPIAIIYKHINAPLAPPRTLNPDLPDRLEKIVMRAMEKDPNQRYQQANVMVEALEALDLQERVGPPGYQAPPFYPASGVQPDISLHVIETGQILPLKDKQKYVIGRLDGSNTPDIDLTPFKGAIKGVSRNHAEILLAENRQVLLLDLDSTNGTWINGEKIAPREPAPIHNGDLISLGKLVIQALIRKY